MIGRRTSPSTDEADKPKGFDDFDLRLGDVMRGERATLAKSLLDVQRELKIKASYIAAIENADVSAFETPGFVAGYVRSYARYLGLDPEWAFGRFCDEADFTVSHGMSAAASGPKRSGRRKVEYSDPLANPNASFVPRGEAFFAGVQPGAIGSILVLLVLIGGLGFGGWKVLQEVQKVQLAPIDTAPGVVADLDPLSAGGTGFSQAPQSADADAIRTPGFGAVRTSDALDRLYRPQALDVPILVARDGPIAAIDPLKVGTLHPSAANETVAEPVANAGETLVQVVADITPGVEILAVRPSWVRVQSADGTIIFEKILDSGERYLVPMTEEPPILRAGNSGSVYFSVNGQTYGPAAPGAQVVKNVALSPEALTQTFGLADISLDSDLAKIVDVAAATPTAQ
ncbi:MAG: RodZ domain-containing protein [Albidovulum sp.]